jgi:type II secretory pathway component HofQ
MEKVVRLSCFMMFLILNAGISLPQEASNVQDANVQDANIQDAEAIQQASEISQKKESEKKEQIQPILSIKKVNGNLYSMELRDVDLKDFFRVVAYDYNLNILIDENVQGKVTASLTNISLEEALERIASMNNLVLKKEGNVIIIKPNLVTKVFILKHVEAESLLKKEETQTTTDTSQESEGETSTSEEEESEEATIYDLLSPQGKVLLGKYPNSIMVIDYPENVEKVDTYIEMIDKGMESKIFRLKYIRADQILGEEEESESESTSTTSTESTGSQETAAESGSEVE